MEAGWSTQLIKRYDRAAVKAPAWRVKEWDYYLIGNDFFALALTVCDNSYMGLDSIIAHAAPILDLLYPVLLTVTVLGLFGSHIRDSRVYKYPTAVAFLVSLSVLAGKTLDLDLPVNRLPFGSMGLAWVVPTIVCAALGLVIFNRTKSKAQSGKPLAAPAGLGRL